MNRKCNILGGLLALAILSLNSCEVDMSSPDRSGPPPLPPSFSVNAVSATKICLNWSYYAPHYSEGGLLYAEIQERRGESGEWTVYSNPQTLANSSHNLTIRGREPATKYSYRIRIRDTYFEAPYTAWSSATVKTGDNLGPWREILFDDECEKTYVGCPSGTAIAFFDADHGLLLDTWGMLGTSDGGGTWTRTQDVKGRAMSLWGADRAIVVDEFTIWHTTDRGQTWVSQLIGGPRELRSIDFAAADTAWVGGIGGVLLKTIDGGKTWTSSSIGVESNLMNICFVDTQNGFVVSSEDFRNKLIRTRNGGVTWEILSLELGLAAKVAFWDAGHGVAIGWTRASPVTAEIYRTGDGGDSWSLMETAGTAFYGITTVAPGEAVAVGMDGSIVSTVDGGVTWHDQNSGTFPSACGGALMTLYDVDFVDPNLGFAIGSEVILKTTTGGN
jgi:photosystem II stability/assembly factor-like uncharacterized protein